MPSAPLSLTLQPLPAPSRGQAHLRVTGRTGGVAPGISCASLAQGSLEERRRSWSITAEQEGLWEALHTQERGEQGPAAAGTAWEHRGARLAQDLGSHPSAPSSASHNSLPSPARQGQLQAKLLLGTPSKESSAGAQLSLAQEPPAPPARSTSLRQVPGDLGTLQAVTESTAMHSQLNQGTIATLRARSDPKLTLQQVADTLL